MLGSPTGITVRKEGEGENESYFLYVVDSALARVWQIVWYGPTQEPGMRKNERMKKNGRDRKKRERNGRKRRKKKGDSIRKKKEGEKRETSY